MLARSMDRLRLMLLFLLGTVLSSAALVPLGSTLIAAGNSSWKSDDGNFAMGFIQVRHGTFVMAIWYDKIPSQTVVWSVRSTGSVKDIEVSSKATISLSMDGNLTLADSGNAVWSSNTMSMAVTGASMLNSGNFLLFNNSGNVWESFSHPTHTLLPNQKLASTLTNGDYLLEIYTRGIRLNYTSSRGLDDQLTDPSYWSYSATPFQSPFLNLSSSGVVTVYNVQENDSYKLVDFDYQSEGIMRRLSLDDDGNAKVYGLNSSSNSSWVILWQAMLTECSIYGRCGTNAVCAYMPTPTCICPPGFEMQNGSCVQQIQIGCSTNVAKEKLSIISLYHADFHSNDFDRYYSVSMDTCKQYCLDECKCAAAVYYLSGVGTCLLKSKLSNGMQSPGISYVVLLKISTDTKINATMQFPQDLSSYTTVYLSSTIKDSSGKSSFLPCKYGTPMLFVAVSEFCCLIVCICGFFMYKSKWRATQEHGWMHGMPTRFSYEQLKLASGNFSHKIGSGGFGQVYKGKLPDNILIAIKKLELANHGEEQFEAEVTTIGKVHHINLVRLLGYCSEGPHRLLVHQYIPNGSLDNFLFSSSNDQASNWDIRFGIAVGIARGIMYLHEECDECILHFDIKPQNILLDENFMPKICDFGLAKLMSRETVTSISTIRGTRGYLAPEWTTNQPITAKADVYSYGMLLFEILSGRQNLLITNSAVESNKCYFPEWALEKLNNGHLEVVADPRFQKHVNWEQFKRSMKVAMWCIQLEPMCRVEMSKVVQMLDGSLEVPNLDIGHCSFNSM